MIVVVPAALPPTIPVAAPTVPFAGALLTHVPPVVPMLLSVVVANLHTASEPDIAVGSGKIVTTLVLPQPEVPRKLISLVPAEIPVTTPEVTPIVATAGSLLVHETPDAA